MLHEKAKKRKAGRSIAPPAFFHVKTPRTKMLKGTTRTAAAKTTAAATEAATAETST